MAKEAKFIDCPAHKGEHRAVLYIHPHQFAGMWECNITGEDFSDVHDHKDYEIEEVTQNYMSLGGVQEYNFEIYVCGGEEGCGVQIEDRDPAEDRADAEAEARAS